jgi:hypothetical protein
VELAFQVEGYGDIDAQLIKSILSDLRAGNCSTVAIQALIKYDISALKISDFHENNLNPFVSMPVPLGKYAEPNGITPDTKQFMAYRNLSLEDYLKGMPYDKVFYERLLQNGVDYTESEVMVTLFVQSSCHTRAFDIAFDDYQVHRMSIRDRIKALKHMHTLIRASHTLPDSTKLSERDACASQYLNLLPSRRSYMNDDDWDEDIAERLRPAEQIGWITFDGHGNIHKDVERWDRELKATITTMFKDMVPEHLPDVKTFEEFIDNAQSWLASGSSGYKYSKKPVDKRAAMEVGVLNKQDIISAPPRVIIAGSTKHENGKDRALYSADFISYVYQSYILSILEKYLSNVEESGLGLSQAAALELEVMLTQSATNESAIPWAYDFANFNSVHGLLVQMDIWECCRSVLIERTPASAHASIKYVIEWLIESEQKMAIRSAGAKVTGIRKSTMTSGERGTMFKNIVLNIAYKRTVIRNIQNVCGYNPLTFSRHAGDDVVGEVQNRADGLILTSWYKVCGFPSQPTKVAAQTEFLRYYYSTSGHVYGYPIRTLVNLITRDHNKGSEKAALSFGQAIKTQANKCVARGGNADIVTALRNVLIAKHSLVQSKASGRTVRIGPEVVAVRIENNGYGVIDVDGSFTHCVLPPFIKARGHGTLATEVEHMQSHLSAPYLDMMAERSGLKHAFDRDFYTLKKVNNLIGMENPFHIAMERERIADHMPKLAVNCAEQRDYEPIMSPNEAVQAIIDTMELIRAGISPEIPAYLSEYNRIKQIIASTECNQTDVFIRLVRAWKDEKNVSTSIAVNQLLKIMGGRTATTSLFNTMCAQLGVSLAMQLVNNEISLNTVLEGHVRPSISSYVREHGFAWLLAHNQALGRVESLSAREISVWMLIYESMILRYIRSQPRLLGFSTP